MEKKLLMFSAFLCLTIMHIYGGVDLNDKLKTLPVKASTFGIKADLEYLDVTLGTNNQITKINGSFSSLDVGKFIAIKKGHHNSPSTSTGNIIPFTQQGRIVTVTVYISGVTNGIATVQVVEGGNLINTGIILNQVSSQTKRAYMYTNNFDAIRTAMEHCYSTSNTVLDFDLDGIVGINPFYGTNFVNGQKALIFKSSMGDLEISTSSNAKLKLCTEFNAHYSNNLFFADQGNGDITVDISCIPPDMASTRWAPDFPKIFNGNIYGSAGNSVRTVHLKGLSFTASDVDSNGSFWSGGIYTSSRGGISASQPHVLKIENSILEANGGIALFSQNGATNEEYLTNVTFKDIKHHINEIGRDFTNAGNPEADRLTNIGEWRFDMANFTKTGDFLEVNNNQIDFSFYDYPTLNSSRKAYFIWNGMSYEVDANWTGMTAHKVKLINESTSSKSIANTLVITASGQAHVHYAHPNVAFVLDNVISTNPTWRYYSSGGQQGTPAFAIIRNSTITGFEFNNSGSQNGTNLELENSDIDFYLAELEKLTITNSTTNGLRVNVNEFEVLGSGSTISHGGSIYGMSNFSMTGNSIYIPSYSLSFSYKDSLGIDKPVNVSLHQTDFLGGFLPKVRNGSLTITDAVSKEDIALRTLPNSFTTNTTLNFTNVYLHGINGKGTWFKDGFQGATLNFSEFIFNNYLGYIGLKYPDFDSQSSSNGVFSVTTNPTVTSKNAYYATDVYNHLPYFLDRQDINVMGCDILLSNKFLMEGNKATNMIIATFNPATTAGESYFSKIDWGNNAYVNGDHTFDIVIGDNSIISPYYIKDITIQQVRRNTTLSNLVVSSSFREKDEVVTFRVDPKQARVIEIPSSTPVKHYTEANEVSGLPYFGIDKEIVYASTGLGGKYFKHKIEFDSISNTSYSILQDSITVDSNNNTKIKTGMYFSIGQEFYEPNKNWLNFEFNLKTTNNGTLNFKVAKNLKGIHSDYLNSWWAFESWNDNNTPNDISDDILIAECYIENQTGEIIFNGSLSVEDVADNFEVVSGLKINSHSWETYYEDCSYRDRLALMSLYNATDGPNWANNTNWGSNEPLSTWYGIAVNSNGCVHSINLPNKGLNGSLPEEIEDLSSMVVLNLSNNQLTGSIPNSIGNISNLAYLYLYGNSLTGSIPNSIGELSNLLVLQINHNQLSGIIPSEMGNLSSILHLILNNNLFTDIPSSIGNLSTLEKLHLQGNQLNSSIPDSLGNLSSLKELLLNNNLLTGSMPSALGDLSSLTHMKLQYNQLTGSIPSNFSNLNNASSLDFRYNNLSGCFPSELNSLCGVNDVNFYGNSQLPNNGDFTNFCSSGTGTCNAPSNTSGNLQPVINDVFSIYPNPNSGIFHIKLENRVKEINIEVYNLIGEVVFSIKEPNTRTISVDLKNQPKGIYIVKIISEIGIVNKKIIIE